MQLHAVDLWIIIIFLVFIVWWALRHRSSSDTSSYFLAGKSMKWPAIGLSLFAASVSSSTLMGHSGEGFISGIAVFNYNWVSIIVMVVFAMFFLPFYIKSGIFTIPEFLERRFDRRSRVYFSFITIIGNVFLDAAAALYTGALIIKIIFPAFDLQWIIVGMAIVAGSYTIAGGLSSSINADRIQSIVLIVGSTLLSIFAFRAIGGWDQFHQQFNEGVWLKLTRPLDDPTVPWLGMIVGIPILGFYFWGNNQVMVQRVLSAQTVSDGRRGVLFVGFLYLFTLFIFIAPGLIARGINLFQSVDLPMEIISGLELKERFGINTDKVYPMLITNLLPVGFIGIIIAAMVAALTSTLSATLSSVSTLFTMDFYQKWNRNASSKKLVTVGRLTATIALLIAVSWAPFIQRFDSLVAYYQEVVSYIAPPIVGTFFLGLFWRRSNGPGAFWGLVSGLIMAALIMVGKYLLGLHINLHFLLIAPILLLASGLVNIAVSCITAPPGPDTISKYTWNRSIWQNESVELLGVVWYKNFRIQSYLLIAACFALYFMYF